MKTFGWKSIFVLLIFSVVMSILSSKGISKISYSLCIYAIINLIIGFFIYNILVIKREEITIKYLLNPFKQNTIIPIRNIEKIVITNNSFGGIVSVKLFLTDSNRTLNLLLLWWEHKELTNTLLSKEIEVDYLDL